ncbi:MAG: hypothetical protein M3487_10355 [Actinomycetota bacterium]|nr:hypothetical protein [Acidimicrobiia bacterium]MDQ3470147.1 hypothetical protein [Actinomycetota bacterium]
MSAPSSGRASATAAELSAAVEAIGGYRRRVGDLAGPHLGSEREDLVAAIHEGERALRSAERVLQRALKLASGER